MRSARNHPRPDVILLPGFNGAATQPLLLQCASALEGRGLRCLRFALPRGRPSPGLEKEVAALGQVAHPNVVLVGRSFGGRVAARYAVASGARALVLVGFPVRPPGRPRPDDEAALRALPCPTLIIQNDADPLGPLPVLRSCLASNAHLELHVVDQKGHGVGRHGREVAQLTAQWVSAQSR